MKLWYGDIDYTVTMTGEQVQSPAINMTNREQSIWPYAQSDDLAVTIDIDTLELVEHRDYLAIVCLNFDPFTTISIRGTNSADYTGGITDTIDIITGYREDQVRVTTTGDTRVTTTGDTRIVREAVRNKNIVYEPTTGILNYRYIRLEITNVVNPVKIGRIMIGESFTIVDKEPNVGDNITVNGVVDTTFSGQVYSTRGETFNNYQVKLELTTANDWKKMREIYIEKQNDRPFLVSLFSGNILDYPPTFCRYDQSELNGTLARANGVLYSTAHSFVEVK